jgi:N-acetylneuraminic acid mutarotase
MRRLKFSLLVGCVFLAMLITLASANAQTVVHVAMSDLTFGGAKVCGAGSTTCAETVSISFDWDITTASVSSMSVSVSGAMPGPFSFASTGPVSGGQGFLWTDASGDGVSVNTCGLNCGQFPSTGAYNIMDVTLLCGSAGDTCFSDGFNGLHPTKGAFNISVHNAWSTGTLMPVAADYTGVAVLEEQIYVVGGSNDNGTSFANTQIYDPATNAWNAGGSLPTATNGGCAEVARGVLYFIGGHTAEGYTDAVWAYSPKTQTWTSKAVMPTARSSMACAVYEGKIYVMGGYNNVDGFLATNESYDPATDSWATLASMSNPESDAGAGVIGGVILVTNGSDGEADGNNQAYDIATNSWSYEASDPTLRQGTCVGAVGGRLYSAGGWLLSEDGFTLTESFTLSKDKWNPPLTPMPQGTGGLGRSVTYKGQLYCFGGEDSNADLVGNVEIYQP